MRVSVTTLSVLGITGNWHGPWKERTTPTMITRGRGPGTRGARLTVTILVIQVVDASVKGAALLALQGGAVRVPLGAEPHIRQHAGRPQGRSLAEFCCDRYCHELNRPRRSQKMRNAGVDKTFSETMHSCLQMRADPRRGDQTRQEQPSSHCAQPSSSA